MPRERRTAGAPLRNAKRKKKRGGGARSTAVTAVTAAAAASSSSAPPRAVLPVHARASPSARSSSSSSSAAAAAARRRGCGAQRAATTCGGCARLALRARLLLLLAVAAHVAYGGWFLRGFDGLHPDGISGLLRLRGGSALATVERSFEFEDSTEAEEQSEMSASMEAASMASLFTSFCESVANGDASGIAKVKNTMIEELSHSSGETLAKLQSRSPDFLCELARWVSIEPYKRFLISQRSEGDGSPNPDTLSFENIKNTALVLLSKMVQMPIETLQEMSIYQRGEIFRMISTFTMQYFTMVRHAQIFKAGASTDTNLRSFLLEMGVTGVDAMSAEDVRNSMIDTITPAVKRSTEFVAFLDNAGLEKLAKWFFSPPLKRYLMSIERSGVHSMDHSALVNTCIAELAARTANEVGDLQQMDVGKLVQIAAAESLRFVPYIPAEANDAANLPTAAAAADAAAVAVAAAAGPSTAAAPSA